MKKRMLMVILSLAVVLAYSVSASAVTMDWVRIGDAGNEGEQSRLASHGDTTYYGGVDYEYYIGKYEVTNNQYCEFLNAVDPNGTNTYNLYNPSMSGPYPYGGIWFDSGAPNGSKYSVKLGRGNNPVNFVSWYDALRFANWMHNGQGSGSTETGAYDDVSSDYYPVCCYHARRRRVARVFLPDEDEWYKAAYYKGGGLDAGYWNYATANDNCPISEAPPGGNNSANYYGFGYAVGGHHISDVGAYVNSDSAYSTFDQNGNLWEWTDTNWYHAYALIIRGGSFGREAAWMAVPYRDFGVYYSERAGLGFRVASIPEPTIYYVDADAPPGGDGRSWATAFKYLQDALTAARPLHVPVEIRVARGNYKPDQGVGITPGDRTATFPLISGVTLKGGYASFNQSDPNARDIDKYKTILSGDLDGNDVDVNDPCDLWNEPSRVENSFHVVTGSGTDETAVLDGFTITGGNASECPWNPQLPDPNNVGGGIYIYSGRPTLTNCTLIGNSAWYGGGMYNYGLYIPTSPILNNCVFSGNIAGSSGGGMFSYGGGFYWARPILSNCTFTGNSAPNGSALACDSGENRYSNDIQVTNCILWNDGNEIWNNDGSQITVSYSDVRGGENGVYDPCNGVIWGAGNINADPCFVSPGYWDSTGVWVEGDYHLLPDSPCIDAGDPDYIAEPNETDLDGKPRVIGGRIDMGAYESPIPAEVRIVPRIINLASKGRWITCYIWLPEDYNVVDIDPNSVLLENEIQPESLRVDEQQQVATAKFNRSDVQEILNAGEVELIITGHLTDGTVFEGTDTIKVIDKAGKK